jgi:hypothetical protein
MVWCGLDLTRSGYEPVKGSCEHGNKPWGSIKCWKILELAAPQEGLSSVSEYERE